MAASGIPRREWIAVVFPPVIAAVLVVAGAEDAGSTDRGWLIFGLALSAGLVPSAVYTIHLAMRGQLLLRNPDAIEANRDRIDRLAIPLAWLLAGGLFVASLALAGLSSLVLATALGGALIGFYPGLLANFLRLRKEVWRS